MKNKFSTKIILRISFLVNILDIGANLLIAIITGSMIILSETIQGVVDSIGSLLLVIGQKQSHRPKDPLHPHGYTRSVYYWALLSSLSMLIFGSGYMIWNGYQRLIHIRAIEHIWLAFFILIISMITNGYATFQSYKKISRLGISFWKSFNESGNQLVKTALLRDTLGTCSAIIGFISLALYTLTGNLILDPLGAISIGILVALFAIVLITQSEHFISGLSVPKGVIQKIRSSVHTIPEVITINRLTAVYMGTDEILVDLDVKLKKELTTREIESVLDTIKEEIINDVPQARNVNIDLNSDTMKEEINVELQ